MTDLKKKRLSLGQPSQQKDIRKSIVNNSTSIILDDGDGLDNDTENADVLSKQKQQPQQPIKNVQFQTPAEPNKQQQNSNLSQLSAVPQSKRKSLLPQSRKPINITNNNNAQSKKVLTNEQISEIYSNCIKLSTENKINTKNTWKLNLIDHIDDVLEKQQNVGNTTNFQAASCTLDASIKIYSYRVDSVHTEAFKMLGGLAREDEEENDSGDEEKDPDEQNPDDQSNEAQKKEKKKKKVTTTLESNRDNITWKKLETNHEFDPLFQKTSAAFDEGGVKGLLLNKLEFQDARLVLDSNELYCTDLDYLRGKTQLSTAGSTIPQTRVEKMEIDYDEFEPSQDQSQQKTQPQPQQPPTLPQGKTTFDLSKWRNLFKIEPLNGKSKTRNLICPSLAEYAGWSTNEFISQPNQLQDDDDIIMSGDVDMGQIDLNVQDNFAIEDDRHLGDDGDDNIDFGGGDIGGFDFGATGGMDDINDDFDNNNNYNNNNNDIGNKNETNEDKSNLEFTKDNWELLDDNNESWILPQTWKLKMNRKATELNIDDQDEAAAITAATTGKKKSAKKKGPVFIDFDAPTPPDSMFEPPKGRQTTTLTSNALKKASENSTILPPDIHYDPSNLCRLFNKPQWIIPPLNKREQFFKKLYSKLDNQDISINNPRENNDFSRNQNENHDYHNDSFDDNGDIIDNGDFCDGGGFDMNQEEGDGLNMESTQASNWSAASENDLGKLIEEPFRVNSRIDISYARIAKKIDVKELKSKVWNIIDTEKDKVKEKNKGNSETKDFNSVFNQLQSDKSDISTAMAFLCVLHLANEKELYLSQSEKSEDSISNFTISRVNKD